MQVNRESCILNVSSLSNRKLSAFSNQSVNSFLNHAFILRVQRQLEDLQLHLYEDG